MLSVVLCSIIMFGVLRCLFSVLLLVRFCVWMLLFGLRIFLILICLSRPMFVR